MADQDRLISDSPDAPVRCPICGGTRFVRRDPDDQASREIKRVAGGGFHWREPEGGSTTYASMWAAASGRVECVGCKPALVTYDLDQDGLMVDS
jgi:hypothetical protein